MSPWSQHEDDLLRIAVAKHGVQDNWKAVAAEVPGRNNKACRKRWLHSLSPMIKKSAWTTAEDALLVHLYTIHGPKWSFIARQIDGRTDDACSKRYNDALDPNLKREEWTSDEDASLLQAYGEIGGKWREIGFKLQRSSLACRNRFKLLERKKKLSAQSSQSTSSQSQNDFDSEFPYYPPESYPLFSTEDTQTSFREHTPEAPPIPAPAPFQYSSSSLSAALEERPAISHSYSEHLPMDVTFDQTPESSSTSSPYSFTQEFIHNGPVLLDDMPDPSLFTHILPTIYSHHSMYGFIPDDNGICPAGPSQIDSSPTYQANADPTDKLPPAMQELMALPDPFFFNESPSSIISPELSPSPPAPSPLAQTGIFSIPSSPLDVTGPSSPISSPGTSTSPSSPLPQIENTLPSSPDVPASAELPVEPSPSQSLLFSTSTSHPKGPAPLRNLILTRKQNQQGPTRLSASLPLSDETLRPYACGHSTCWPNDASDSAACFSTARELFEHVKLHKDPEDIKPYRCGLSGCSKYWKSLNGLQYHLQLSSSHFQQAMSKTFSALNNLDAQESADGAESDSPDNTKRWVCDRPNCFKSYKNSSGLRYHKKHGHPTTLPMQLDNVPPALARSLPARTRKMRKKDIDQSAVATAA
ncbi:hypothetical protein GYMLUDRAFT_32442 [Collybiopsis luxurians FD-317 M1]|nr:hypothetical protein GYMLUDRAFT_32442 [Collybiopsis luxurians FD-317 M1]